MENSRHTLASHVSSAFLYKLSQQHNASTDLGDLLKQLLVSLLRLWRKDTCTAFTPQECSVVLVTHGKLKHKHKHKDHRVPE